MEGSNVDMVVDMLRTYLRGEKNPTDAELRAMITKFGELPMFGAPMVDAEVELVLNEIRTMLQLTQEEGELLEGAEHKPWLADALSSKEIEPVRWEAFRTWQSGDRNGLPVHVLGTVGKQADRVVDLLGDPRASGEWRRRGLLLGAVQSGKTVNYLAIMNKAADAGYRMFVVLTSNTDDLRRQTQERVDEGFVGATSLENSVNANVGRPRLGIGNVRPEIPGSTMALTTRLMDFSTTVRMAQAGSVRPTEGSGLVYVAVIKKNVHTLRALNTWLAPEGRQRELSLPLVVIDDESDNASVNTASGDDDPTAINAGIRRLLSCSTRSTYLAVTATPFANIFIDDQAQYLDENRGAMDDLFPKDYILAMNAPSNYCGNEYFFGTVDNPKEESVHEIDDMEPVLPVRHHNGDRLAHVPPSLEHAVATFLVSATIAGSRGVARRGSSMLVNVSRFVSTQRSVAQQLRDLVEAYRTAVQLHPNRALGDVPGPVWTNLRTAYRDLARGAETDLPPWPGVAGLLGRTLEEVQVRLYNGNSEEWNSQYIDDSLTVPAQIAVGGIKLGRGLTLPGLLVSYVHRSVTASDVLLQMARWFGYRDGYRDLLRVWMNPDLVDRFRYTGESVRELQNDLRSMREQGLTPKDYGLKVSKRPESLLITAQNKARSTAVVERVVSLAGRRIETSRLLPGGEVIGANLHAADDLVRDCEQNVRRLPEGGSHSLIVWSGVRRHVVETFLNSYRVPRSDMYFGSLDPVRRFVADPGGAPMWDLAVVQGEGRGTPLGGLAVRPVVRSVTLKQMSSSPNGDDAEIRVSGKSSRLAGSSDVQRLLSVVGGESESLSERGGKGKSENDYYRYFDRPALMLYPVEPSSEATRGNSEPGHHVDGLLIGAKIIVPGDSRSKKYDFVMQVNSVLARQMYGEGGDVDEE